MLRSSSTPWGIALRLASIAIFLVVTNYGLLDRIVLLIAQGRTFTLIAFLGIWGLSILALLVAAFQPSLPVRAFWALVFSVSTAVGYGMRDASGTDFGVMEAITFWSLRNEAPRALEFYWAEILAATVILMVGFLVLVLPPVPDPPAVRRWLRRLGWTPAVPVAIIAAIVFLRDGGGHQAMPTQFAPVSVAAVSSVVLTRSHATERRPVEWQAENPDIRNVVILMDESVRPDYLDWERGNPYTPDLAELKDRFIDFGPAASGSTCSAHSNAMLRFAASKDDLGGPLLSNPTIWQYAKSAGFRTVFIDAQAGFMKDPGRLHSYMTVEEANDIDGFHLIDERIPAPQLDRALLDVMEEELASHEPTFVYAIKTGVHFPYDSTYPDSERVFTPTMSEANRDSMAARINSYRNGVRWNVDAFFAQLYERLDLSETLIVYTSDHGQNFRTDRLTHCSVEDPDPREGLVPLHAITDDANLRERFLPAARAGRGHASHFQIVPTVFEVMGYDRADISGAYGPTMFEPADGQAAFTYGDILGLFSDEVRWHELDLTADYLEQPADTPDGQELSAASTSDATLAD